MPREVQQPTLVRENDLHGKTYTHPAFGAITASRVTGHFDLFDNNVGTSGAVRIEITEAHVVEDGHHSTVMGIGRRVCSVYLSEAQWVAFISRMNYGTGTPCTIDGRHTAGYESMPGIPPPPKPAEALDERATAMLAESTRRQTEAARELEDLIDESGLPAKKANALRSKLAAVVDHGQSNRRYQHEVLAKLQAHLVNKSKIEIDAMLSAAVTKLGLASIEQLGAVLAADPKALLQLAHNPQTED